MLADKLRELGVKGTGDEEKARGRIEDLVALEVDKSGGGGGGGGGKEEEYPSGKIFC